MFDFRCMYIIKKVLFKISITNKGEISYLCDIG